jgi:TonB family protein
MGAQLHQGLPGGSMTGVVRIAAVITALALGAGQEKAPTLKISEVGKPPRLIEKVEPQYDEEARKEKVSGTVILSLAISPKGVLEDIEVKRSLDPRLDRKAMEALAKWRFEPAEKGGKPVRVMATVEINFRLE